MNPIQGKRIKQQLTTVTLIYINMHVDRPRYCQGTAS